MKNRPLIKTLITGIVVLLFTFPAKAQLNDVGKIMSYQTENAQKLFKAYVRPFSNAMGTNLSNAWYNDAKPHKTLGFDITFSLNTTFVPDAAKTFNPQDLDLEGVSASDNSSPTINGPAKAGAELNYTKTINGQDITFATFELPQGTGMGLAPAPMLQAGVGIVKGTELIGRYVPNMSLGSQAEIGLWGVGVKHSIKQWIPVLNKIPVLHLSVMGGYTKLNSQTGLNFMPQQYVTQGLVNAHNVWDYGSFYDNQKVDLGISSFTTNLVVSANLPVVTFYGGIGLNSINTDLALKGNYPLLSVDQNTMQTQITKEGSVTDPIDMEIKHKGGSTTDPRYNIGMRFKFAVITLHFDYTYSNYSVATAGLGISIR